MMRDIQGYPELPTNIFIDGTAMYAGAAHGYTQLVFNGMLCLRSGYFVCV
jgi:hypothetical protein